DDCAGLGESLSDRGPGPPEPDHGDGQRPVREEHETALSREIDGMVALAAPIPEPPPERPGCDPEAAIEAERVGAVPVADALDGPEGEREGKGGGRYEDHRVPQVEAPGASRVHGDRVGRLSDRWSCGFHEEALPGISRKPDDFYYC